MKIKEFNTGDPIGYFLTWTAYGTWLPGDERGWQKKDNPERQFPNELFREMAEVAMKEEAFHLLSEDRQIVGETIARHCEIRNWNWHLHTVEARSNHVHVIVTASDYKPEVVRDQFKAWCTRKLKGTYPARKRFWAEGGSRRWLNTQEELDLAIQYVVKAQDRK